MPIPTRARTSALGGYVTGHGKAVQARHRQFHLPPLMCEANQFSSWSKMLGSIRGRPVAPKLPIQKATVRWLLAWRPGTLAAHRARLLTVVATLACLRVNEVARLQVCDLWFDYLMSYGVPGLPVEGTCSVHINRRKNDDTQRKGHYPARGIRSWTPWRSCAAGWSLWGLRCIRLHGQ
jgi:hypothetical protein